MGRLVLPFGAVTTLDGRALPGPAWTLLSVAVNPAAPPELFRLPGLARAE